MNADWYLVVEEEEYGPLTVEMIRTLALNGRLQANDLVWSDTLPDWKEVSEVSELWPFEAPQCDPPSDQGTYVQEKDATGLKLVALGGVVVLAFAVLAASWEYAYFPLTLNGFVLSVGIWSALRFTDTLPAWMASRYGNPPANDQAEATLFTHLWREKYWILVAGVLLGSWGIGAIQRPNQETVVATRGYWRRMDFNRRQLISKLENHLAERDISKAITECEHNASMYREAANDLSVIPATHAFPAIIELANNEVAYYNDAALCYETLGVWLTQVRAQNEHSISWSVLLESFVRGFAGDPFGKTNELLSEQARLRTSFQTTVQPKIDSLLEKKTQLRTSTAQLHIRFSKDFGVELSPMAELP